MTFKTVTATIVAATLSTAAFAQQGGVGVGAGADTGTSVETPVTPGIGAGAGAGVGAGADVANQPMDGQANFGQIISGLNSGASANWSTDLQGLGDDPEVQIVRLSELKGEAGENSAALDQAIARAEMDVDNARTTIGGNATLAAALTAESYTPEDVVGVQVEGDSKVTLIVNDTM